VSSCGFVAFLDVWDYDLGLANQNYHHGTIISNKITILNHSLREASQSAASIPRFRRWLYPCGLCTYQRTGPWCRES